MKTLLKLENLAVSYHDGQRRVRALTDFNLTLDQGCSLGLIGESGSGKTSVALAIMGLLQQSAEVSGKVYYRNLNLQQLSDVERDRYRWAKIALVFQNGLEVLNPVLTIDEQIAESIQKHTRLEKREAAAKVRRLLKMVGLDPERGSAYPHQLSGGMRQKILIAMALACDPELLIVDEPTTALDPLSKREIVTLLMQLQQEKNMGMLVISHDLTTIKRLTSRMTVLYDGHIMEEGLSSEVLERPAHPYTRGLINATPALQLYKDLWGIPGEWDPVSPDSCPFYPRCNQRLESCRASLPLLKPIDVERRVACHRGGVVTLLEGKNISKSYSDKGKPIVACEHCELAIRSGEVVALIGESGSGKSTLAGIMAGIGTADRGEVRFEGVLVRGNTMTARKNGIQIVFQDPLSATNEHLSVGRVVQEPLDILRLGTSEERRALVRQALHDTQLSAEAGFLERKCHTLSGGQRQRVSLARSLVLEPKLLIADEISSMMDASTQANILRLLKGLQNSRGFAMLYITHDLVLSQKISDWVYIMHSGKIIENGPTAKIFTAPRMDYTQKLVSEALDLEKG
jgi:peptide/nickel transport system ATP-binding protein